MALALRKGWDEPVSSGPGYGLANQCLRGDAVAFWCLAVQVNTTTMVNQTVDNSFDDPFVRLMRASSIEEALALNILYKDDHIATAADLNSAYDPSSGKLLVKRPFDFATPDGCSPRNLSVRVDNVMRLSASSRLYPKCIQMPRCGGCCGIPYVDCVPLLVVKDIYSLVEISISDGSLRVVGTYPVEVERHVSCYCVCSLSDEKCAPHKKFNSAACSCICPPKRVHCYPPKMYDPHTCGCVCDSVQNCCESSGVCNFAFNHDTCDPAGRCRILQDSVYGSAENSKTVYNSAEHSKTVYDSAEHSKTVYGSAEHSKTVYGSAEHSKTVYGSVEHSKTVYGSAEHSKTVYGSAEHSKTVYGSAEHSKTVYGSAEHSKTVYGSAEHSKTVYGSAEHSKTVYGSAEHSKTVHVSAEQSKTVYDSEKTEQDSAELSRTEHNSAG
ncbi:hypothetical protein RRG08_046484 [Elysia crispata]|uniref:Platelet-derived growth factor (PDGF) family profile domain-containing protein n=1 Tax=Elysia crispata TaxID=231223 RepID=A0AAE0YIC8_9GAST|nr:hypothetical protein RRG08_046484 [Elysia crispata]